MSSDGSPLGEVVTAPLPPHEPANMMSLYMTRYDYDYNRDGGRDGDDGRDGAFEPGVSGDVHNRPIFAIGVVDDGRDARTVYQVDYTGKDRTVHDMQGLAASMRSGVVGGPGVAGMNGADNGTAYQKHWYRPALTAHIADDVNGGHPHTTYQEDYKDLHGLPMHHKAAAPSSDQAPVYPGAAATAYNADLLKPHGVREDDGADIAPKITSKESLLPRRQKGPNAGWAATIGGGSVPGMPAMPSGRATGPATTLHREDALPGTYTCTSWDYGDVSQAHPSQLPRSLAHSINANGVDVTANSDKAALLRQLAGKKTGGKGASGSGTLRNEYDRTNPQYLSPMGQKTCAVSRRLEEEHYVHMSMYRSDYVDQAQLPELPGNHGGPADVRDTQTLSAATPGEMIAGQLTKTTREMGLLRNSHGTLKSLDAHAAAASSVNPVALASMRTTEKAMAIDRADPHRHKLHM